MRDQRIECPNGCGWTITLLAVADQHQAERMRRKHRGECPNVRERVGWLDVRDVLVSDRDQFDALVSAIRESGDIAAFAIDTTDIGVAANQAERSVARWRPPRRRGPHTYFFFEPTGFGGRGKPRQPAPVGASSGE